MEGNSYYTQYDQNMNISPEILGTGIGYTLSVVLFVVDQIRGGKAALDVTKALQDDRVIRDYLEWLPFLPT